VNCKKGPGNTWLVFLHELSKHYDSSNWMHSNSKGRFPFVVAKWKVLANQQPDVNLGRVEHQFYLAATLFNILTRCRFTQKPHIANCVRVQVRALVTHG